MEYYRKRERIAHEKDRLSWSNIQKKTVKRNNARSSKQNVRPCSKSALKVENKLLYR